MGNPSSVNILLHNQMRKATISIEITRVRILVIFLALGLLIMSFNFFLLENGASFFKHPYSKFIVVGWLGLFLIFEIISFLILNNYFQKKIDFPNHIKNIFISIEAFFSRYSIVYIGYPRRLSYFFRFAINFCLFYLAVTGSSEFTAYAYRHLRSNFHAQLFFRNGLGNLPSRPG